MKRILRSFLVSIPSLWAASVLAQSGSYFRAMTNLNPVGYWPMHEVEAPAPGDIETNYGTLGLLGTGYYPDWVTSVKSIVKAQPGALQGDTYDNNTCVQFVGIGNNTSSPWTNALYVPHTSPLSTLNPPYTVECWANPSGTAAADLGDLWGQNGYEGLNAGAAGGGTGDVEGTRLYWDPNFYLYTYQDSSTVHQISHVTPAAGAGLWIHLVVTCDAGTNMSMYVNGNLDFGPISASTLYRPDYWTPFEVGSSRGNTRSYGGLVQEVAIYTNVLQNIAAHYTAGTSPGAGTNYFQVVTNDNPVIYLRMNSGAYTPPSVSTWPALTNYGSAGGNGVYNPGTMPGIVPGPFNPNGVALGTLSGSNVAQFSGVSSFAVPGNAAAFNPTGPNPISLTVMFRGNPSDNRVQTIVGHSTNSFRLWITTSGNLACQLGTNTTSAITSAGVYNDGQWHQAIMVYTPASVPTVAGTNALYVDGSLDTLISTVTTNGILPGSSTSLMIAADPQFTNTPAGVGQQFAGQVCEVALFASALSPSQIANLYNASGVAPYIRTQPASGVGNQGGSFTFSVVAAGPALSYQWFTNGVPSPGATNSSLVLNPVTANEAGTNYYVVVTNSYGSVTSTPAALTVNSLPSILSQLPAQTSGLDFFVGTTASFSVAASGTAPLTYYWVSNGVVTAALGTNPTRLLTNSLIAGPINYDIVVSNSVGTATSLVWTVSVIAAPTASFPTNVLGLNPSGYWRLNEPDDSMGDNNDGQVCHDYVGGNDGIYTNTVLGQLGYNNVNSAVPNYDPETCAQFATVAGGNNCAFGIAGVDLSAGAGTNSSFTVQAWVNGSHNAATSVAGIAAKGIFGTEQFTLNAGNVVQLANYYRFQVRSANGTPYVANSTVKANDSSWHLLVGVCDEVRGAVTLYIDGTNAAQAAIPSGVGITSASASSPISIGSASSDALGVYDQQFSGFINDVAIFKYALNSNQVMAEYLAFGFAPQITQQPPSSTNVSYGAGFSASAAASGSTPLSYQWLDEFGNPVPGATNLTLIVNNVTTNNTYWLVVTNAYGQAESDPIYVTVVTSPTVVQDLQPLTFVYGSAATLAITVAGGTPISYGWQFNGNPVTNSARITGATTAALTLNPVEFNDAGTYQVFFTNSFGNGQSTPAALTVVPTLNFNGTGAGWYAQSTPSTALSWEGNNVLQLTDSNTDEDSAAFYNAPVYIGAFQASFTYQVASGPSGSADGTTFCIQNDPRGTAAIGGDGGQLGVGKATSPPANSSPITPSVELEFNIFSGNSVGGIGIAVATNGAIGQVTSTAPVVINSGDPINVVLSYLNGTMTVALTDTVSNSTYTTSANINVPSVLGTNLAYVGFTGADGGSKSTQVVSNFNFVSLVDLSAALSGTNLQFSWPAAVGDYALQQTPILGPAAVWTPVATAPSGANGQFQVLLPPSGKSAYYRLVLTNAP